MSKIRLYEYFSVTELEKLQNRKTAQHVIKSLSSGKVLGIIKWYGAWRQYCFFPNGQTIWNEGCLADVINYMQMLNDERRKK